MKLPLLTKVFLCTLFFIQFLSAEQYIYLSSADGLKPSLESYKINSVNGDLSLIQNASLDRKPGVSCVSPDGKFLYLVLFPNKKLKRSAALVTYSINDEGLLKKLAEVKTSQRYIYVSVDPTGKFIFGVNKSGLYVHELLKGLCKEDAITSAKVGKSPHSVKICPQGQNVYAPHIKSNLVHQYHFNKDKNEIKAMEPATVDGPNNDQNFHDPRHLAFNKKFKVLYTSNEMGGGISSWKRSKNDGSLTLWQTKSTLPKDFNWIAKASDIYLSNDSLFAYVANRDNTDSSSPTGNDSIAIFSLDPKTGALSSCIKRVETGRHVRSILIDKSGSFFYAAGVGSSDISIYQRDSDTGFLKLLQKKKCGISPMWISLLSRDP